jgi:hypothetical protein
LNNSLAFWLKNSLYFSCCLQGGLFLYPQQLHIMHPLSKNARSGKADGFGETNPTVTQIESMQTWPNEPKLELAEGQRAGRTSLSRDSARMVISAIIEGLRHNDFRHFPQTKPISANEANGEKPKETTLQDEQRAPLSGVHARACYVPVRGRRDLLFVNPSKKALCNFHLLQGSLFFSCCLQVAPVPGL